MKGKLPHPTTTIDPVLGLIGGGLHVGCEPALLVDDPELPRNRCVGRGGRHRPRPRTLRRLLSARPVLPAPATVFRPSRRSSAPELHQNAIHRLGDFAHCSGEPRRRKQLFRVLTMISLTRLCLAQASCPARRTTKTVTSCFATLAFGLLK
jgi:hypothetical protein